MAGNLHANVKQKCGVGAGDAGGQWLSARDQGRRKFLSFLLDLR